MQTDRRLLVIGSNPPITSGARTRSRAEQAADLLGFNTLILANLFSRPTYRSGGISVAGIEESGWNEAKLNLAEGLDKADAVLLAYGITRPGGEARTRHVAQVAWLHEELAIRHLDAWTVGGQPRHPSRWQRFTSRTYPELSFSDALRASFEIREASR